MLRTKMSHRKYVARHAIKYKHVYAIIIQIRVERHYPMSFLSDLDDCKKSFKNDISGEDCLRNVVLLKVSDFFKLGSLL